MSCSCSVVSQSGNFFNVNCQGPNGNRFYSIQASSQYEALVKGTQMCTDEVSINSENIISEKLLETDIKMLTEYAEDLRNLGEEYKDLYFNCVIVKDGKCGEYGFGNIDNLLNSNSNQRFRVTVRTFWNSGQQDEIFIVEAGSRVAIGCDQVFASRPTIYLTRQIVGEVII